MSLEDIAASQQRVCHEIGQVLPAEWQRAWVQIEYTEESCALSCFYSNRDTTFAPRFVSLPHSVFEAVRQLREHCRESNNAPWSTATLLLAPQQFYMDYGYEPVPIEGEMERRRTWKKKYMSEYI